MGSGAARRDRLLAALRYGTVSTLANLVLAFGILAAKRTLGVAAWLGL